MNNNILCKLNTFLLILILAGVGVSFYFLNHQQNKTLTELSIDIVNANHRTRIMLTEISKFLDHKLAHMSGGKFENYVETDSMKDYPLTEFHTIPNDFLHQNSCKRCNKMMNPAKN